MTINVFISSKIFLNLMQPIKKKRQKDGIKTFLTNHFFPIKQYRPPSDFCGRETLHLWMMIDLFSVFVLLHLALDGSGGGGGGQDDRRMQMQINLAAIDSLSFSLFMGAAVEQDLRGSWCSCRHHRAPSASPSPHSPPPPETRLLRGPPAHGRVVFVSHNVDVSTHTLRGISLNSCRSVAACVCARAHCTVHVPAVQYYPQEEFVIGISTFAGALRPISPRHISLSHVSVCLPVNQRKHTNSEEAGLQLTTTTTPSQGAGAVKRDNKMTAASKLAASGVSQLPLIDDMIGGNCENG